MKIAIYGSRRQEANTTLLRRLFNGLVVSDVYLAMSSKLYDHLSSDLGMTMSGVERVYVCPDDADMAVSIGGDGTFLRTVAWVGDSDIPVLGINTGHLGYLSALTLPEAVESVDSIIAKTFRTEYRTLLTVVEPDITGWPAALNEVVIAKEDTSSMISASVSVNGHFLADYRADGVIVSTPTGSTAYNLSVGGPVVQPTAPVFVVSPVAAHSLSLRPLVLGDDSEITINVEGRGRTFRLTLDGRAYSLPLGTTIRLRRAVHRVAVLQLPERDFTSVLNSKLMFS